MLVGAVWVAVGLLALLAWRSGPYVRRTGMTIALAAATVWAVPYYSPGLTQGPGDALLILGLAGLAAWPQMAVRPGALVPYAAGFGAVVGFFEMMTGQYPVAAAWLAAVVLAARRDRGRPENGSASTTALVAVAAFCLAVAATTGAKLVLADLLTELQAGGETFLGQLRLYMSVPKSDANRPGLLLPFLRLMQASKMLTFGRTWAGYALIAASGLAWLAAAIRGWRGRHTAPGRDVLLLAGVALIPVAWVFALPQHMNTHAQFMVRILVIPISLAPLALIWPGPHEKPAGEVAAPTGIEPVLRPPGVRGPQGPRSR
jgi:hypothetical protein